ncbi:hypothetical protein [Streptomyces sp. NPDC094032]
MSASFALTAQLHAEHGDVEGTRQEALIDVLAGMHALCVTIGDAQNKNDE